MSPPWNSRQYKRHGAPVIDPLHQVCWSITQSKCGESLEWQLDWTGAPYDEWSRKGEDFILEYAISIDFHM